LPLKQVIQELLSGVSTPAQLTRRYEIFSGLIYRWKKHFYKNLFSDTPKQKAALRERVIPLDQLVGKLTLEQKIFYQ
jgi:hypothetical protein